MKYLKRFNESLEDWDLEEISDIFQDVIDEGFRIDDVHIGQSLTISPKLWCNSHHDFVGKSFPSLSITFRSQYENPKYDLSILDILDESIKHFESFYGVELESIYTVGIPTIGYSSSGARQWVIYNWFNSCETIRDINKVHNDYLKDRSNSPTLSPNTKVDVESKIDKLTLTRFDLTFDLTK